jgi:hypothetical protein
MSKITKAKRPGGVAQAVDCLLYKDKTLSSNPIPPKVGKKKKKNSTYSYIKKKF